ncbi:chitinase-like protein 3 [Anopheles aquasalis]|uniref:chitinase-like protein 3 n=1 Tax=Anopheles aquasalis TaxID=42839 RepID=UPI00215B0758|nr:chitinase-like protein 3 [Anopheles aquasalis]
MMSKLQGKYELLKEETNLRQRQTYIQVGMLVAFCGLSCVAVFATWSMIYRQNLIIPPTLIDIPAYWRDRIAQYETVIQHGHRSGDELPPPVTGRNVSFHGDNDDDDDDDRDWSRSRTRAHAVPQRVKQLDNERILPSRLGNYIYSQEAASGQPVRPKLVCYYTTPDLGTVPSGLRHILLPEHIDPLLCTHLNIGIIGIDNCTLLIDENVRASLNRTKALKRTNPALKILLWIGGGSVGGFSAMVENHANRKRFIQSVKGTLEQYRLDGIDLDWEFPDSGGKRRMHFSQLLHEIRREYQREHRTYILSVAVAPQATLAYLAYDVGEINSYADYVNLMSYDFHFYSPDLPQTGLNAPLYRRPGEVALLATLNINASVHYWLSAGLERSKLIVGLPTYGHSYTLVNPFNTRIGAPAAGNGRVGMFGFASYSEVCWFRRHNIYVLEAYDEATCSPYLHAGTEWISYDDERSVGCKADYIVANGLGGAMVFSLNTDDFGAYCADNALYEPPAGAPPTFPLLRKVRSVLFGGGDSRSTDGGVH